MSELDDKPKHRSWRQLLADSVVVMTLGLVGFAVSCLALSLKAVIWLFGLPGRLVDRFGGGQS